MTYDLPHGWAMTTVERAGEVNLGRQRSPKYHTGPSMRPYLRVANVFEDRIDTTDVMQMQFSDAEFERYRLEPGDILLNEGQTPELLGRPAMYRGLPENVCFTNSLIRFRARPGVDPRWSLLVFRQYLRAGRFKQESRITTNIAHLSATRFASIEFPVPPLAEQERIVEAVDEELSRLDAGSQGLRSISRRLALLRDTVLTLGVTGRLLTRNTDDGDSVHLLGASLMRRQVANGVHDPPAAPLMNGLPPIPSSWTWASLDALAAITGGVTKDSKRQADPSFVEVPYLRVANVQRGRLDLSEITRIRVPQARADALALELGDILLNEGGDRDKLGRGWVWEGQIEKCIHQNHVFRARLYDSRINPRFVSWFANTVGARWFGRIGKQTTNLASISLSSLKQLPVPVPPEDEQARIVAELERQLSIIDVAVAAVAIQTQKAVVLRSSILDAAVSGRLVRQNPANPIVEGRVPGIGANGASKVQASRGRKAARAGVET